MLYLCDDGKDPEKQAWLTQNYGDGRLGEVHYITGRSVRGDSQQLVDLARSSM